MTEVDNVTRADFLATLNKFAATAAQSEQATIYFAGHGLQLGGVNYLVPVDARLAADATFPTRRLPSTG